MYVLGCCRFKQSATLKSYNSRVIRRTLIGVRYMHSCIMQKHRTIIGSAATAKWVSQLGESLALVKVSFKVNGNRQFEESADGLSICIITFTLDDLELSLFKVIKTASQIFRKR